MKKVELENEADMRGGWVVGDTMAVSCIVRLVTGGTGSYRTREPWNQGA